MSAPNTSNAFNSEATQADKDAEIARLKAEIEEGKTVEGQLVDDRDEDPAVPDTVTVHDLDWSYHLPTQGQLMMFGMSSARRAPASRRINGIYNFLDAVLTDESYNQLEDQISGSDGEFGVNQMMDLITAIIDKANNTPDAQAPRNGPTLR